MALSCVDGGLRVSLVSAFALFIVHSFFAVLKRAVINVL